MYKYCMSCKNPDDCFLILAKYYYVDLDFKVNVEILFNKELREIDSLNLSDIYSQFKIASDKEYFGEISYEINKNRLIVRV